jgi:cobalt-zinc-cadmium efflux system outer membrane protein
MKTFCAIFLLLLNCLTAVAQIATGDSGMSPRTLTLIAPSSEETAAPAMSLEEMIEELKAHHPQLEQGRKNYLAAKAIGPQVLAPNNPQIGFINNPMPGNPLNFGASQGFYYTLTESFPFPGKKRLPAKIADDQAEAINTQTDTLYLQLVAQLKNNFYQSLLLQRELEINRETVQRLEQIKEISKIRYAQNAAIYVDFLNAQVAKSSAENDQFSLERQIETVRQTLNTLIGRDPGSPLKMKGEIPEQTLPEKTLSELETLAIEHHPGVKGSLLQIEAAKKGVNLAKLEFYPDFNVVLYFNSSTPPLGVTNVNSYGTEFDITFPLFFFGKEKYSIAQAKSNLEAYQANDLYFRQQTRLAVDSAYNALSQAINQTKFIKSRQLIEAKTAYRLALANYSSGSTAFIDLLTAQHNLQAIELSLAQSENNGVQAYANLAAAVGTEIH